jgi:hypothetical protein
MDWAAGNLATQGYRLAAEKRQQLWLGSRFATGMCLPLAVAAIVLQSHVLLIALAAIGAVAGLTPWHPLTCSGITASGT